MESKNSKIFNKEIMQAVSAFCESQEIKDVDNFMYLCFKQGFDIKRYGLLGKTLNDGEKDLIKEVIVEKRVEIPVEVIKEVEKIVEVPVDRIVEIIKEVEVPVEIIKEVIKEIPIERVVEKEIYITDDEQIKELSNKIERLQNKPPIEKIVEVPVDRIVEIVKEVEKIVEVPVEKIVTNIEYIRDQKIENELFGKIEQLENETAKKNEELDELSQTLDELRQKLDIKEDNDKVKLLQQTIQNIRSELQQKNEQIKELEKINRDLLNGNQNQAYLLRGSNLNRRI
jgi:DNA repair exonuclease SbcCD ATPase subunit